MWDIKNNRSDIWIHLSRRFIHVFSYGKLFTECVLIWYSGVVVLDMPALVSGHLQMYVRVGRVSCAISGVELRALCL